MSTGTTLVDELEQAAERTDMCAAYARQVGNFYDAKDHAAEAARLRQRAAWVLELEQRINAGAGIVVDLGGFVRMLTGPDIPAETAPTEPNPLGPPLCEEVRAAGRYCYVTTYHDGVAPIKSSLLFKTPELANECARRLRADPAVPAASPGTGGACRLDVDECAEDNGGWCGAHDDAPAEAGAPGGTNQTEAEDEIAYRDAGRWPGPAAEPGKPAASMPSLINQLMMGADAWAQLANQNLPGLSHAASQALYEERSLRARQYRERAERIRYWIARAKAFRDNPNVPLEDMSGPMVVSMLEIICGEVPSEPAGEPGKPATCDISRVVCHDCGPLGRTCDNCAAQFGRATPGKGGRR